VIRTVLFFGFIGFLFFVFIPKVYAASSVVYLPQGQNPASAGWSNAPGGAADCADTPKPPSLCSNGASIGTTTCAGESACPSQYPGSNTWTKYALEPNCQYNPFANPRYAWLYNYNSAVYSIADKCTPSDGASYLRSGYCDGSIGGIYKTCCNNSGGGMASASCVQVQPYSGAPYPPYDGVCPSGSHSVTCGYAGAEKPTCGPSACGDVPTATPTPSPSPTPTTNLCYSGDPCTAGQVNSSVCSGTGVSKTCYNFGGTYCWWPTTCQSGTACYAGVCRVGCAEGATQSICIEGTSCNL
jgi:hypothetical protein